VGLVFTGLPILPLLLRSLLTPRHKLLDTLRQQCLLIVWLSDKHAILNMSAQQGQLCQNPMLVERTKTNESEIDGTITVGSRVAE
jgi:hypothetical protein